MTLPSVITALESARPDSLSDLRAQLLVVARAVEEVRQARPSLTPMQSTALREVHEYLVATWRGNCDRRAVPEAWVSVVAHFISHGDIAERDALAADVQRLNSDVADAMHLFEMAKRDRDAWKLDAESQRTRAAAVERETVERIAKMLDERADMIVREMNPYRADEVAENRVDGYREAANDVREWKETAR